MLAAPQFDFSKPSAAISFDLDETLIERDPPESKLFIEICQSAGIPLDDSHFNQIERFRQQFFSDMEFVSERFRRLGGKAFWQEYNRSVVGYLTSKVPNNRQIREITGTFQTSYDPKTTICPDVLNTLLVLSERNLPLGVLTSRPAWANLGIKLPSLAFELNKLGLSKFFSFKIDLLPGGFLKPHHKVFQSAASASGIRLEQLLHVGNDLYSDYMGATTAGAQAVLLDRHGAFPEVFCRISSMEELLFLI